MLSAAPMAAAAQEKEVAMRNGPYNQVPDVLLPCSAPFDDDEMKIQGSKWLGRQWWQSMRNLEYAMYLVHQSNADNGGKHGAESLKMFKSIIQPLTTKELVSRTGPNNNTALHFAAFLGDSSVVAALIDAGGFSTLRNSVDLSPLDIAAPYAKLVSLLESALISEGAEGRLKKGALDLQNRQESMTSLTESASVASLMTMTSSTGNTSATDLTEAVTPAFSMANNHFVKMETEARDKTRPALPASPAPALAQTGSRLSSLRNIFESVNEAEKQRAEESARRLPPANLKLAKKPTISVTTPAENVKIEVITTPKPVSPTPEVDAVATPENIEDEMVEEPVEPIIEEAIPEPAVEEHVKEIVEARPLPACPAVDVEALPVPAIPEKDITFTLPLPTLEIPSRSVSPAKSMVAIQHAPSVRLWDGTKVRPNRANAARCASPERNDYVQFGTDLAPLPEKAATMAPGKFMLRVGHLTNLAMTSLPFSAWVLISIQCGRQSYQSRAIPLSKVYQIEQEFAFKTTPQNHLDISLILRTRQPQLQQGKGKFATIFRQQKNASETFETVDTRLASLQVKISDLCDGQNAAIIRKEIAWQPERRHEWPAVLMASEFGINHFGTIATKACFVESGNRLFNNLMSLGDIEQKQQNERQYWKDGFMSQMGGDVRYWRRRYYRLVGIYLHAYHETFPSTVVACPSAAANDALYHIAYPLSSLAHPPTVLSAADYLNDNEYPVPHSFKLDFENGEMVSFYCETAEDAHAWCDQLGQVWRIAHGQSN